MEWLTVCGFGIEFSCLVSLSESGRGLAQSGTLARGVVGSELRGASGSAPFSGEAEG